MQMHAHTSFDASHLTFYLFSDYESLRNKFRGLINCKKPTGSSEVPPFVLRAREINQKIEKGKPLMSLLFANDDLMIMFN